MKNGTENVEIQDSCYQSCKHVKYSMKLLKDSSMTEALSNFKKYGKDFSQYFLQYDKLYHVLGNHNSKDEFLTARLQRVSLVHINFEEANVLTVTKDAKITPPDMVGSIGGTLGVFVGFSFLGLLDTLIEFFQYVHQRRNPTL